MKNRIISVLLIFVLVFSGTSCSVSQQDKSDGATKVVVDCFDRTVQIPENPKRVTCMYASTAHMMAMLGKENLIVGCVDGIKRDVYMRYRISDIDSLNEPYQNGSINAEELASMDTDLVLLRSDVAMSESEMEKLDKLGIPYVVVDYYSVDQLKRAITLMGEIFDEQERAAAYIGFMEDTFKLVSDKVSGIKQDDRYRVYHSLTEATKTDVKGSICGEIMDVAGIVDVSIENGLTSTQKNTTTTLEEIYTWDPYAIVANEYLVADYIRAQKKWQGLTAVKENRVYTLPIGVTRWCHHGSMEPHMGSLFLAELFYPDLFSDFDMNSYIKDYYEKFFGLTLDDNDLKGLLDGTGMRKLNPSLKVE